MPDLGAAIDGLPYFEIAFDRDAALVTPSQVDAVVAGAAQADDLVVMSHGWNNDADEARGLYAEFFANFAAALTANGVRPGRRVQLVGVLWPSKRFADADLIPGGAAAAQNDVAADAVLRAQLDALESLTGHDLSAARAQVGALRDSTTARRTFIDRVLAELPVTATAEEAEPARVARRAQDPRFLETLGTPVAAPPTPGHGGAAGGVGAADAATRTPVGGAAGIGDLFGGIKAGAINLLNYTTYYVMKDRAGRVGHDGVAPVLARLRSANPAARLHLVGHSFGGRVVTAAAAAGDAEARIDTLALLQAAFSHYAFAQGWNDGGTQDGLFRPVVAAPNARVRGVTIVTHTRNDSAVGTAYAIASRVAGQVASGIGDAHDPYGGLGGNGALKTPEAVALRLAGHGEAYAFAPGAVYNLDANGHPGDPGVITSHGDVRRPEVAHAVAEAVRLQATGVA